MFFFQLILYKASTKNPVLVIGSMVIALHTYGHIHIMALVKLCVVVCVRVLAWAYDFQLGCR